METIEKATGLNPGERNDNIDLDWCGCLGFCGRSPNVAIDDTRYIITADRESVMKKIEEGGEEITKKEIDLLTLNTYLNEYTV